MKPPKTAEVNKLSAMVRFLVRFVNFSNGLETRIEQLEKSNKALKKQLATLKKQIVAPTSEQETSDE